MEQRNSYFPTGDSSLSWKVVPQEDHSRAIRASLCRKFHSWSSCSYLGSLGVEGRDASFTLVRAQGSYRLSSTISSPQEGTIQPHDPTGSLPWDPRVPWFTPPQHFSKQFSKHWALFFQSMKNLGPLWKNF